MLKGVIKMKSNMSLLKSIDYIEGFTVTHDSKTYNFSLINYHFENELLVVEGEVDEYERLNQYPVNVYIQGRFLEKDEEIPLVIYEADVKIYSYDARTEMKEVESFEFSNEEIREANKFFESWMENRKPKKRGN